MRLIKQRGVGLIEILVTILVIAIGLLGLAGMQTASMKNINNSHNRALATIAAYDMAERMRSNPAGVKGGSYDAVTVNESTNASCGSTPGAAVDICEWAAALKASFSDDFVGSVTAAGLNHKIKITWTELDGNNETGSASAPDFTMEVRIYAP